MYPVINALRGNIITVPLLIICTFWLCSCACIPWCGVAKKKTDVPRNVILLIGDGMGVSQVTAAQVVKGELNMGRFRTVGLMTTYSADKFVTDSAASGTALATGYKTYNGAISVNSRREPLKTVLEWAEQVGKSTGIAVTCSVTHATPAVFMAHIDDREKHNQIAQQIADSDVDVLLGGGWAYFTPQSMVGSKRQDELDLVARLSERMTVVFTADDFFQYDGEGPLAAFFAGDHPPRVAQREVSLAEMTSKAIKILSQDPEGFFLMVEGSQIDWGGHENDQHFIVSETIDFDNAVAVGMDFAQEDGDTLVIVTSDHETGGFALLDGSIAGKQLTRTAFTSNEHTAAMVPVFAYGPGSEAFGGIQDNTDVGRILINYMCRCDN